MGGYDCVSNFHESNISSWKKMHTSFLVTFNFKSFQIIWWSQFWNFFAYICDFLYQRQLLIFDLYQKIEKLDYFQICWVSNWIRNEFFLRFIMLVLRISWYRRMNHLVVKFWTTSFPYLCHGSHHESHCDLQLRIQDCRVCFCKCWQHYSSFG